MEEKTRNGCKINVDNRVAGYYIEKVIEDIEKVSPGKVEILQYYNTINNFRNHYSKRRFLTTEETTQGENEISLALGVYQLSKSKDFWN